jgi:hypothetical protein
MGGMPEPWAAGTLDATDRLTRVPPVTREPA